jgi:hypothetical protein
MPDTIQIKRGLAANVGGVNLAAGECAFTIDTGKLYIGTGTDKILINPDLLASPALTGTPTVPTAAAGTNTTQIANTSFVMAAIAALINSSPAALDTLNELSKAIGNDANFATTMTNSLSLKAPLASPALTGTPTAPTAAASDNSTKIATTAYVQSQGFLTNNSDITLDGGTF